jgi:hypothetical protein
LIGPSKGKFRAGRARAAVDELDYCGDMCGRIGLTNWPVRLRERD